MVNDVMVRSTPPPTPVDEITQIARLLAASGYFDARGASEQAIAQLATKILAGREMGFGDFASVQGIHVIQGKPAMSANLMAAAVKSSPRYDYRVRQMDDSAVQIEFFERVNGKLESIGVSTFTAEDAKKAGTQNMSKFPRNMLFARAMSNGVRWYCPDVFFGSAVYTPEELDAGEVIEVEPRPVDQPSIAPTPPVALPPEVATWRTPDDAYAWSVQIGASANVFAARNAFARIVDAYGGRLTRQNAQEIYLAFYEERRRRAEEKAALPEQAPAAEAQSPDEPLEGLFA